MKSFCLLSLFVPTFLFAQQTWKVTSPERNLQLQVNLANGDLTYNVQLDGSPVINASGMGISCADADFSHGLSFVKATSQKIDEQYVMLIGKRRNNHYSANQTTLRFKNAKGEWVDIQLRASHDGVAFRYVFPQSGRTITVVKEETQFAVPEGGKAWFENYDLPSEYTPAYEGVYVDGVPVGQNAKDSGGWAFPALLQANNNWVLITESNLNNNFYGSHLQQDCSGGVYKIAAPLTGEALGTGNTVATGKGPFATPWRTIIAGKGLGTIVESNLVNDLADPNRLGDVSWVKPGRASWSWWSDHASSKDFNKLKSFVDLAKTMGWEYSLVDANWNIMSGGTIEDLVKYASSKHIGLWLWYNSGGAHNKVTEQPRDIMSDPVKRKAEFKKLHGWGVKGVKVDFFQSDKQELVKLYHDIIEDAAREHIMVNFHGCTLPRGWSRTYPNLMGMEAVRGAENYGWSNDFAKMAPELNNILTFTRNVVGPMDYTPITFSSYDCCPHTTTNTHELALSVLFENGILHFADKASEYLDKDERIRAYMSKVPAAWDETRFMGGEPGKETILARRSGTTWYIAGANGEAIQKMTELKLPFLSASGKKAWLFTDGSTPKEIAVKEIMVSQTEPLQVQMLPNGGFVLVIK